MTTQAVHACQILPPTLEMLRERLTFVIQCRDIHFKDVTVVEHLMKTYAVMHFCSKMSAAYEDSQKIKTEIVNSLLAYTQPNPEDQESVYKSLWTHLIKEVIQFTLTSPSTSPQLKDLLIRVCLQLADLAPNMTLVVSKAVMDLILDEGLSSLGLGTTTLSIYYLFSDS